MGFEEFLSKPIFNGPISKSIYGYNFINFFEQENETIIYYT